MASSGSIEIVGREPELERVAAWLELVSSGPAALIVGGEAGIGKTCIWDAAVGLAREADLRVLVTRPVEAELPLGYTGLGDLLTEAVAPILEELPARLARGLAAALLIRDQVDAADPLAVARGTLLALRALAARSPIVLAVDDLQWLDAASARALAYAVRRLEGERIGIVASLREGHPDPLDLTVALRERAVDVRLTGLSAGAVGHMVRRRVAESTPRRVVLRIHERSGGNPFFALELARAPDDALPASLRELVEQRLQTLPGEAASAVELAAILGSAPHAVFDEPASLDAAVAAGVLVEHEGEVRFAHPLLAAGAYELLTPSRRRVLHRQAAGLSGSDEQRARHLALATSPPDADAAAALEGAARAAHQRGASEFAVELAAHARRLTPADDVEATAERTLLEGEYLYVTADEPAASDRIDEVLASGVRGAVRARALLNASLYAVDPTLAVRRCEEAVAEVHDDARLAARSLSTLAWQRGAWLGDVEHALPEAVAAVELARPLDDERTLATVLTCAGLICSLAADVRTEGFFEEAVEIAGRIHMVPGDRAPRSAFAHCLLWRGSYTRAASLLAVERAEAERDGDEGAIMRIGIFGGELESRRGNWDESERLLAEALEEARDYWRIAALQVRALVRGRRGDPEAAVDAAEIASSPPAAADPVIAATADYARGLLAAAAGDVETAADLLTRLAGRTDRLGAYEERVVAAIPDATLALVEAGRIDEAELLTARLERRAAKGDHPWVSAAAELCRGSILLSTADIDASLARLAHSRKGFACLGAQWELARTLLVEGNALRRAGRRTEAAASLDRAATVFGALRAEPWRRRSLAERRRASPRPRRDSTLTAAESRVVKLVAAGRTNREVAAELFTTIATVEAHLTRVYRKLGLRSRTELARAVAEGHVELDS